jgi:myosin protein heavy chain
VKIQKESEDKNETLRMVFDQAADHLVLLESQQQKWIGREAELVSTAQQEIKALHGDKEELQKVSKNLTSLVSGRKQDLSGK